MLASDIEITKIMEDAKFNRDQSITRFMRVEFYVGKHGPFSERIDKAVYSVDSRDTMLNAFADTVRTP